ncbi:MAG: hypothetical protein ABFD47_06160 [Armatimonadota bacterium]
MIDTHGLKQLIPAGVISDKAGLGQMIEYDTKPCDNNRLSVDL